jgi:hypothetical protein
MKNVKINNRYLKKKYYKMEVAANLILRSRDAIKEKR